MRLLLGLAVTLFLAACGGPVDTFAAAQPLAPVIALPLVDLRADVNRDGVVDTLDPAEDLNEETWDAAHGAVFLANIDDDSMRCPRTATSDNALASCHDAADQVVNGPDDLLDMASLKIAAWVNAPATAGGRLAVTPAGHTRLFRKNGDAWDLFDEAD